MIPVDITGRAEADLLALVEFISDYSPVAALEFVNAFERALASAGVILAAPGDFRA